MSVPLLDLKAQYASIRAEVEEAIERVVSDQRFILGPEVESLEAEVASYSGAPYAVGCGSGTDALLLALMALDVGPGDEVVCPSYTFFATAGSIWRLGARPVFVDIDPATYNLDLESLRSAARRCKRLKAILPVHLYGQAADMNAVTELARELGVPVVEDAAQAIGARDASGMPVGARDNLACLSFFPSKNLGAFGDAGMVLTHSQELAERMTMLRVHGMEPKYFHPEVGINSRLDALQAAVLRVKLRHLDEWTKRRQQNAAAYDQRFAAAGAQTSDVPLSEEGLPLRTPLPVQPPATHIYNQYVIRVPSDRRDALRERLTSKGIGTEIYYPTPLHLQDCFVGLGYRPGDLPRSEAASRETLALPIYPELTVAQLDQVVAEILGFL